MSAPMMVVALLGIFGVPGWLLWKGEGYRRMSARGIRAWRGGVVGYGVSLLGVAALLLLPPYLWPPANPWIAASISGGLLLGPVAGAALGAATTNEQ